LKRHNRNRSPCHWSLHRSRFDDCLTIHSFHTSIWGGIFPAVVVVVVVVLAAAEIAAAQS